MQKMKMGLLPTLVLGALSGSAAASGFQLLEQNASGVGNAFAGSAAVAENASTVFYNPAGMTQLGNGGFSLGANAIRPSFKFTNSGSTAPGAAAAIVNLPGPTPYTSSGNGGDAGGDWAALPNFYLAYPITRDLYFGLGVGAPFGLKTQYNSNTWMGAFQSVKFDIQTLNINPSLAYKINDAWSVGLGVNYQKFKAEYVARTLVGPIAAGPTFTSGMATYHLDDAAWGWNAGLTFQPEKDTRIGVSYRSTMKYDLSGKLDVSSAVASPSGSATAPLKLPDTLIISASHALNERWDLLGDLSWTGWSSIQNITIASPSVSATPTTLDLHFRNTWRVAVGANYQLTDQWKLKFGVAYDQSPVNDAAYRPASLPDNNRTWYSIGVQFKPTKQSTLDAGYAYLHVKDAAINNQTATATRGSLVGSYSDNASIVGVQYSYSFD